MQALYAWEMSQDEQAELLNGDGLESSEEGLQSNVFARLLVQGTVKNVESIDEAIKKRLQHWDITRIARVDLAILRMSVYCLLYQPDLPASVVINEAVDIAKNFGSEQSFRFINGVLDAVAKGRDT